MTECPYPAPLTSFATGEAVEAEDVDLLARVIGGRPLVLHKAYPGTLAATTGVAARIVGTTVHAVTRGDPDEIRIGHTSGVMAVKAGVVRDHDGWHANKAIYQRTARRLAEGTAFVRHSTLPAESSA